MVHDRGASTIKNKEASIVKNTYPNHSCIFPMGYEVGGGHGQICVMDDLLTFF